MIEIDIPGFGFLRLDYLVSDFTGTLSADGVLLPGIKDTFQKLAQHLEIHVLTADTLGMAREALEEVNCNLTVLSGQDIDTHKESFIRSLGADRVVAIGNGNNDRLMLKAARIGIAVSSTCFCSLGLGGAGAWLGVSVVSTFLLGGWSLGSGIAGDTRFTRIAPPFVAPPHKFE